MAGLSLRARVRGVRVRTDVPEQPVGDEALAGGVNRATAAIGTGDFGMGIEAGLVWSPMISDYFDVQYAAIVDRAGYVTVGHGPGFTYPPRILESVKAGRTVGMAMARLTGIRGIGSKEGAIGYLTERRLDRGDLTESAVLMAMVPRIRRELVAPGGPPPQAMYIGWAGQRPHQIAFKTTMVLARPSPAPTPTNPFGPLRAGDTPAPPDPAHARAVLPA